MGVLWESTDQFGNMFIGVSSATSFDELKPDLESLVDELRQRGGDGKVTVDFDYGEINGPDPEAVSHVLQVAWLGDCDQSKAFSEIETFLAEISCPFELSGSNEA